MITPRGTLSLSFILINFLRLSAFALARYRDDRPEISASHIITHCIWAGMIGQNVPFQIQTQSSTQQQKINFFVLSVISIFHRIGYRAKKGLSQMKKKAKNFSFVL